MIIQNTSQGVHTIKVDENLIILLPGNKQVTDKVFNKMIENPKIKAFFNKGIFKLVEKPKEEVSNDAVSSEVSTESQTQDLSSYNASDAIDIISAIFDVEELRKYKDAETRKTVLKALDEQIASILDTPK